MMTDPGGAGGRPLRSESARRLTPEIRRSKFPGTPRPGVTLALAAPGPPVQLRWTTLRVQGPTLRDAALANGGHGSPPVASRLLVRPHLPSSRAPKGRGDLLVVVWRRCERLLRRGACPERQRGGASQWETRAW